jgi:thiol-disulfide isomerase/thioredoxin
MNSSMKSGAPEASEPPAGPAQGLSRQAKLGLAVLVVCALAATFWPRGDKTFKEPGGFPLDLNGRPAMLGSQLAPVSLVHFWATWCPPCVDEIPALQRLTRDFQSEDFSVVMIAVKDEKDKVTKFLGPGWDMVLFDPTWDVAHRYGTDKLPETYLVVRGQVVEKFVGATDWDDPQIRDRLSSALGAPAPKTASARRGS